MNDNNYSSNDFNEDINGHMQNVEMSAESAPAPGPLVLTEVEELTQVFGSLTVEPSGLALWVFCPKCTEEGNGWGAWCSACFLKNLSYPFQQNTSWSDAGQ